MMTAPRLACPVRAHPPGVGANGECRCQGSQRGRTLAKTNWKDQWFLSERRQPMPAEVSKRAPDQPADATFRSNQYQLQFDLKYGLYVSEILREIDIHPIALRR
jgi:hypothetical protein